MSYKKLKPKDLINPNDPMSLLLMLQANNVADQAENKTKNLIHKPILHEAGWEVLIETDKGSVGLWSCWLKDQFALHFPLDIPYPDKRVKKILGVVDAQPVATFSAYAVEPGYTGDCKDENLPLEKNKAGQLIAYARQPDRQWAKFYAPKQEKEGGRVWVEYSDFDSYAHYYKAIKDESLKIMLHGGHDTSKSIVNYKFDFANKYSPDGPTAKSEAIQVYKQKFLNLMLDVARFIGKPKNICINYGFVLVPEQLNALGYHTKWIRGGPSERKGFGADLIYGYKKDEEIVLESANSLVPWVCYRQVPYQDQDLIDLFTF